MTMSIEGGLLTYTQLFEQEGKRHISNEPPTGRKVKYLNKNGYLYDLKFANQFFKEGQILTVKEIYVGRSSSKVVFFEQPTKEFNTALFEDVKDSE